MAGVKGRSGRKSKADEAGLSGLIDSAVSPADWRAIFRVARNKAKRGDVNNARFLAEYRFGKPHQSIALEGGGEPIIVQVVYDDDPASNSPAPAPASGSDDNPEAGEEI